ncbi:MAG TPA: molybdopterin cofactor-binding domain-containing protein [Isosphaeraceae bacterium]|jgi:isoquinoline 1-oxidoreductase|nr:molybdopterin cofactor-binding domain-containing protein [Isosphaeraceae bacterium]
MNVTSEADVTLELEPERYELQAEAHHHLEFARREFFRILGGGLIILSLLRNEPAEAQQQESGAARRRGQGGGAAPREIGAWLHIGEDGAVTVYTGKAEVGQNIRTSLAQAVADELRVELAVIRLVMGDTALTPFDMGTFGSRTTPSMAPQLRRAAASARELLIDMAAERWKTSREPLTVEGGKVMDPRTKESLQFGQLTRGQKLMKAIDDQAAMTPASKWEIAGRSAPKADGRSFVTGRHEYASDIKRPGMLHGKMLRSPALNGTLKALDTSKAEAMSGVFVVHDGNFAGVVAPDEQTATRALAALKAEWTYTEKPSEKTLFDDLKQNASQAQGAGRPARKEDENASIEKELTGADLKREATYTIAYIAHTPLEPRAAVAEWSDGKLTVWTGTQRPFGVKGELTQALGIPEASVRVIVPDTGAGYGGKHTGDAAVEAARLAKAAGKPVKLVWTREEEFTWAYFRPAGVIDVAGGVSKDGTLTAWEFHNYNSGGSGIGTPYEVAHQKVQFHQTKSPLRQGSYRALASTANHFARESHIDELAHAVTVDPLAFRLKNLKDKRLRAVLEAAAERFGWGKAQPSSDRGLGIACGTEKGGYVATCAEVAIDRSRGTVQVVRAVTAFECGAIVNPDHLTNQVEGAVVMGLGGALFEAIHYEDGKITNPRLSRYRVPRFSDIPAIETILIDRKDLPSAGAGESPIVAIAPAIGNAIFSATGIRLRSLPMVPNGLKV